MDIKSLEVFLDLSKRLHFANTAQALHMTPSALSRCIQRLEGELKIDLFRRDNRTVELTQAGRRFARYARKTVSDYYRMNQELDDLRDQKTALTGDLTLFCTVTAAHIYVPDLLNTFRRRYPNADIKLITGDASQGLQLVQDGRVDFAFATDNEQVHSQIVFQKIEDIHCSLIAPTSTASFTHLLEREIIPWDDIPFVMPEAGPLQVAMKQWFKAMKIQPDVYAKVMGHEAIVSMTSLGCGLSIIPDPVLDLSPLKQTVRTIASPVAPPVLHLGIIGLSKTLANPLMKAFWSLGEEIFGQ